MNDWYEKGELPPVGTECFIYEDGTESWCKVKIVAKSEHDDGVYFDGESYKGYTPSEMAKFKPLKTKADQEREDFINTLTKISDDLMSEYGDKGYPAKKFYNLVFDAGYRKVKPLSFVAFNQMYRQCDRSENLYHMIKSHIVSEG